MLNSLLNTTQISIDSLILNVVIILGVVIAGALIVYFLWEAVTVLVNKAKNPTTSSSDELHLDDDKKTAENDNVFVSDYKLDAEPVKEDETANHDVVLIDANKVEDVNEQKAEEEKAEAENEVSEDDETAKRRAYLEARRQELIRRMQEDLDEGSEEEKTEETEENKEEEEEKTEGTVEEPVAEEQSEPAVETAEPETTENVETVETVENDSLDEERKNLVAEKEKYETMVKELAEAKKALEEQNQEAAQAATTASTSAPVLSLDELKQKLEQAEERLKASEKEFKQCKKEYIPLRKVWAAHEKDEKKLRRKEALVAKQKVLLYGVNNYAEIDQEKAQKLAEDLDLLDGLKLSVQHCEEVMKKNEERYPLLEKMYNVLKDRNDELKKDIASYREEIAKLEGEQGSTETESQEN